MGILFAISVLALAALLWASLSIARHIRDERQRHAGAGFGGPAVVAPAPSSSDPASSAHELSFSELSPYGPAVVSRTLIEHTPEQIAISEHQLTIEAPAPAMAQQDPAALLPLESPPSLEALEEREAHTEAEAQAAIQARAEAELAPALEAQASANPFVPALAPQDDIALTDNSEPPLPAAASAEEFPMRRAVPTFLPLAPRPPAAPPASPLKNRLDWTYFNKDMGDLSDPLPSHPRLRPRPR